MSDTYRNTFHGRLPIGLAVKEARECHWLTMGELERRAHLGAGYLSKIESGEMVPGIDRLDAIAGALKIETWRLVEHACKIRDREVTA